MIIKDRKFTPLRFDFILIYTELVYWKCYFEKSQELLEYTNRFILGFAKTIKQSTDLKWEEKFSFFSNHELMLCIAMLPVVLFGIL